MKNYETLKNALKEIERWGEDNGGRWCREHARHVLASIDEHPNEKHKSHKSVRSSEASQ